MKGIIIISFYSFSLDPGLIHSCFIFHLVFSLCVSPFPKWAIKSFKTGIKTDTCFLFLTAPSQWLTVLIKKWSRGLPWWCSG